MQPFEDFYQIPFKNVQVRSISDQRAHYGLLYIFPYIFNCS